MIEKFNRDVLGNSLAVIVLIVMVVSLLVIAIYYVNGSKIRKKLPTWAIPILSILGIGVAIYMTIIETTRSQAICGPIGDCNAVQQSDYAYLFGIIPIGIFGLIGYSVILVIWIWLNNSSRQTNKIGWTVLWGISVFGTLFSIYLTFLEPFVIGATCIWCILSAVIMTLLLWSISSQALANSSA